MILMVMRIYGHLHNSRQLPAIPILLTSPPFITTSDARQALLLSNSLFRLTEGRGRNTKQHDRWKNPPQRQRRCRHSSPGATVRPSPSTSSISSYWSTKDTERNFRRRSWLNGPEWGNAVFRVCLHLSYTRRWLRLVCVSPGLGTPLSSSQEPVSRSVKNLNILCTAPRKFLHAGRDSQ